MKDEFKPTNCDLILLENCMLRCKMCHMWRCDKDVMLVPTDIYGNFIKGLYDYFGSDMQILFVGGEPLLKDGIEDLIRFASDKGFFTSLTSNGYLINKKRAFALMDSGISSVVISIDSLNHNVHDYLRGVKGVLARALSAIKYLSKFKSEGQSVCVVSIIMEPTLDYILELADWADTNEDIACISFQVVAQPFFTGYDNFWYRNDRFSLLWPKDVKKVKNVIDELIVRKERKAKIGNSVNQLEIFKRYFEKPQEFVKSGGCHLGYNSLSVNSSGNVFLCFDQPPIGNIMRDEISDIWMSQRADYVRSRIKHCNTHCKSMINCFSEDGFSV